MKKIDQAVKEMKAYLKELDDEFNKNSAGLSDSAKAKAKELLNKTKTVINNSIEKVNKAVDNIKDDERLDDFLDEIKARSKEAVELTKSKINALDKDQDGQILDDLHDDIMAEFNELKESQFVNKTAVFIKDINTKMNEFLEKPEVQETISKVKTKTVDLAEKGVKGLKKVLDVDSKDANKKAPAKKACASKKPAKKTATKKTTKK